MLIIPCSLCNYLFFSIYTLHNVFLSSIFAGILLFEFFSLIQFLSLIIVISLLFHMPHEYNSTYFYCIFKLFSHCPKQLLQSSALICTFHLFYWGTKLYSDSFSHSVFICACPSCNHSTWTTALFFSTLFLFPQDLFLGLLRNGISSHSMFLLPLNTSLSLKGNEIYHPSEHRSMGTHK